MRTFLRLVFVFAVASLVVAAIGIRSTPATPTVHAQEDAQTPDALCEAAQEDITEPDTRQFDAPEQVLEPGVDYRAIFCTEQGAIYVDLFEQYTPVTVNSFVFLAEQNYYNNSNFHRVLPDFMVQGGDPVGEPAGTGGPGYQFEDEVLPFLGFNDSGWLAMANAGPGTNGSQFFITRAPTNHLHGRHTVFGRTLEGQAVVDNLTDRDPQQQPDFEGDTLHTVLIITDPASVETTYEAPAVATADETLAAIEAAVEGLFIQGPAVDPLAVETRDLEAVVAQFDDDTQEQAQTFYETHGFESRATGLWQVSECPQQPDLIGFGYAVTDWGSEANAAAAVADPELIELQQALGFEALEDTDGLLQSVGFTTDLLFTQTVEDYCDTSAVYARYIWNRGRYTLTIDVIVSEGAVPDERIPAIMGNFGFAFTGYVGDIILAGGYPSLGFEE